MARVILEECELKEDPVDIFAVSREADKPEMAPSEEPCPKRQRHGIKGPPRDADVELRNVHEESGYGRAQSWDQVIKDLSPSIPRVGNMVLRPGHSSFPQIQMLAPEIHVKMVLACRGTE